MPNPALLSESAIHEALRTLPKWKREDKTIRREFECPSFLEAIRFVQEVAGRAEDADHHPDIDIRYRRVTMRLTTDSSGGLTPLDFEMAREIDAAAEGLGLNRAGAK